MVKNCDIDQAQRRKRQIELSDVADTDKELSRRFAELREKTVALRKEQEALQKQLQFFSRQIRDAQRPESVANDTPEDKRHLALCRNHIRNWQLLLPVYANGIVAFLLGKAFPTRMSQSDTTRFKREYESTKAGMALVCIPLLIPSLMSIFVEKFNMVPSQFLPSFLTVRDILEFLALVVIIFNYLSVCLRESILVQNGSRIRSWWRAHHYIVLIFATVLLVWPEESGLSLIRSFLAPFAIYIFIMQMFQTRYQLGRLYTRATLGGRPRAQFDVTSAETGAYRSSVSKAYMLPFLFIIHFLQIFMSVLLLKKKSAADGITWQALTIVISMLVMGLGNFIATVRTLICHHRRQRLQKDDAYSDTSDDE